MRAGRHEEMIVSANQWSSSAKVDLVRRTLGNPVEGGELGVVLAIAGVGKTACLTHIALEHLLAGMPVLHVSIGSTPEKVKVWYQEFLKNLAPFQPQEETAGMGQEIERRRFILSYVPDAFSVEKLEQNLQNLETQANFHPTVMVLDGLDFDQLPRSTVEDLKAFAKRRGIFIWMSARMHRHISDVNANGVPYPCDKMDDLFRAILFIEPSSEGRLDVKVLKQGDEYKRGASVLSLNAQTFLIA